MTAKEEFLELAKKIYALKVVLTPSWDLHQLARDSLNMATHFFLVVQAEQGPNKTAGEPAATAGSRPASQPSTQSPGMSSSGQRLRPDSTTGTAAGTSGPGSTVAATAAKAPETAPGEDKGSTSRQSQQQDTTRAIQEQPYPPYQPQR